jgi:hypothetical protein
MHWCPDEHRNLCSNYTSSKEGNAECTMTKTFVHINIYCNLKNWALIEVGDIVVLRITNVKIREGIGKGLRWSTRVEKYIRAGEMTILPSNPDTIFRLLFQKVNFGSHVNLIKFSCRDEILRNIASGTILFASEIWKIGSHYQIWSVRAFDDEHLMQFATKPEATCSIGKCIMHGTEVFTNLLLLVRLFLIK